MIDNISAGNVGEAVDLIGWRNVGCVDFVELIDDLDGFGELTGKSWFWMSASFAERFVQTKLPAARADSLTMANEICL